VNSFVAVYGAINSLQRDISIALAGDIRALSETGTPPLSLIALALLLGAIHALTPGHGKSIILSYFIGHGARAIDALVMAGRVAFSHSLAAVLLVLLVGGAAQKWGRPSGAAETLQVASYALIAILGLFYLYKALRQQPAAVSHSPHVLPYAVGVLPCPLTMLVVGNAIAAGSIYGGIGLAAVIALGATATISLFGATGILLRKGLTVAITGQAAVAGMILTGIEVISSLAIFLIGLFFLIGSLIGQ
jgi:nickel/cobalt transporter (NicO) family protein